MLQVLTMLGNESGGEFLQRFANLWDDGGADEVFDGLFFSAGTVDFYLELEMEASVSGSEVVDERSSREHTTYSSSSVSCATSGTVIDPATSSLSFVLPTLAVSGMVCGPLEIVRTLIL